MQPRQVCILCLRAWRTLVRILYIGFDALSDFRGSICGRFWRDDTYSKALGEPDRSVSVLEGDSGVRVAWMRSFESSATKSPILVPKIPTVNSELCRSARQPERLCPALRPAVYMQVSEPRSSRQGRFSPEASPRLFYSRHK